MRQWQLQCHGFAKKLYRRLIPWKSDGNLELLAVKNILLLIGYGYEIGQNCLFAGVGWTALGTETNSDGNFHVSRIGIFVQIRQAFHSQVFDASVNIDVHKIPTRSLSKLHNADRIRKNTIIWAWQNGGLIPQAGHPFISVSNAIPY